jgi:acylphosphatase
MQQARITILGFVQSVGYRRFVKWNAKKLGLTGWVKNTSDGRVEALIQGPKEGIEDLLMICKKGPFLAEVKSIVVDWEKQDTSFDSFEIIF